MKRSSEGSEGQRSSLIGVSRKTLVDRVADRLAAGAWSERRRTRSRPGPEGAVQRILLDEVREHGRPAPTRIAVGLAAHPACRETPVGRLVVVQGQPDLADVVLALDSPRRLPGGLDGREQQGNEHPHDGDHHQQLHQGKSPRRSGHQSATPHHGAPPKRLVGQRRRFAAVLLTGSPRFRCLRLQSVEVFRPQSWFEVESRWILYHQRSGRARRKCGFPSALGALAGSTRSRWPRLFPGQGLQLACPGA